MNIIRTSLLATTALCLVSLNTFAAKSGSKNAAAQPCNKDAAAQTCCKSLYNPADYVYADNYRPYPGPDTTKALTPTPEGYTPCFFNHYGRHGSRYLIGKKTYEEPVRILKEAKADGALTPYGEQLLEKLIVIANDVRGHYEELTPRGHKEHQGIATRLHSRFPEIFRPGAHIDAKSSVVIRCILSMSEELQTLKSLEPTLDISCDASAGDMVFINQVNRDMDSIALAKGSKAELLWSTYRDCTFNPTRVLNSIYNNESYWKKQLKDPFHFVHEYLWQISQNIGDTEMANTISLKDLFTEDELKQMLLVRNANWYTSYGASPLHNGRMVYRQRNFIRHIINETDSILAAQAPKPTLRNFTRSEAANTTATMHFGHETALLPTVCFLNLNGAGKQYESMNNIAPSWMAGQIFPMGANLQFVFYRKDKPAVAAGMPASNGKKTADKAEDSNDGILVKVLLNENEMELSDLTPVTGPYYRWTDLRKYCLDKLAKFQ